MSKQIKFTYEGKEYTLEFTKRTIAEMEKKGFVASDIQSKPMSTLPELFAGAFLVNHRFEKREVIDAIYEKITRKEAFIGKLAEMYSEPVKALIEDPEEAKGNVEWTEN